MFLIVFFLNTAPALRFVNRVTHGVRYGVGVHYDGAVFVSCRPADCLNERRFRAQQSFLIRIENRNERHLRQVKPLAQQIYADENVINAEAEVPEQLLTFHRFNLVMNIPHLYEVHFKIFAEVLRHLFRKRCDENPLSLFGALFDLAHKVVDLSRDGADFDFRVEKSRRADDLLNELRAVRLFISSGRRADVYHLI